MELKPFCSPLLVTTQPSSCQDARLRRLRRRLRRQPAPDHGAHRLSDPGPQIDGAWLSRLTREQITRQLKDAGLAKWTEKFLKDMIQSAGSAHIAARDYAGTGSGPSML